MDKFSLESEWADMPPNDNAPTGAIIRDLRDYNISFFPALPGYYSTHEIGGIHYDIRSSFTDEGKNLESILQNVIVERSINAHQKAAKQPLRSDV